MALALYAMGVASGGGGCGGTTVPSVQACRKAPMMKRIHQGCDCRFIGTPFNSATRTRLKLCIGSGGMSLYRRFLFFGHRRLLSDDGSADNLHIDAGRVARETQLGFAEDERCGN